MSMERELCSKCKITIEECQCYDHKCSLTRNLFNDRHFNLTYYKDIWYNIGKEYPGCRDYYLVFAPLRCHEDSMLDMKRIEKYLRDRYKYKRIVITREIYSDRVHYNVMFTTHMNARLLDGRIVQKFYIKAQIMQKDKDLRTVWDYIFKESEKRPFTTRGTDLFT